jgi:hypothetical protein
MAGFFFFARHRFCNCRIGVDYREDTNMRIYDSRFKYTPSTSTNILSTWKRHGFRPTTERERLARQRDTLAAAAEATQSSASVTPLDSAKRKGRGALRLAGKKSSMD